jgi:hypothetical protein
MREVFILGAKVRVGPWNMKLGGCFFCHSWWALSFSAVNDVNPGEDNEQTAQLGPANGFSSQPTPAIGNKGDALRNHRGEYGARSFDEHVKYH